MSAVFDRAHFEHMTGGERALQLEIVALFREQASGWVQGLAGVDWRARVHTIKGSARGIGLVALALACEAAEEAGGEDALAFVHAELAEAMAALEQFADAA